MEDIPEISYAKVTSALRSLRRREVAIYLLRGAAVAASIFLSTAIALSIAEARLYLPPAIKLTSIGLMALLVAYIFIRFGTAPLRRKDPELELALRLEELYPEFRGRLVGAIQLWPRRGGNPEGYSVEMIEAVTDQSWEILSKCDVSRAVRTTPLLRPLLALAAALAVSALVLISFPGEMPAAIARLLKPTAAFVREPRTHISVSPGDTEVLKGGSLDVKLTLSGDIPATASVFTRAADGGTWERMRIDNVRRDSTLSCRIGPLLETIHYYAAAGEVKSPIFRATVIDPPEVLTINLKLSFPEYTGLGELYRERSSGDITAPPGTRVLIEAVANRPLRSARLVAEGWTRDMRVEDTRASARISVSSEESYHIELEDLSGRHNPAPVTYHITPLEDMPPSISIISPEGDIDLDESMAVPIKAMAWDDYGISKINLVYRINGGEENRSGIYPPGEPHRKLSVEMVWDLSPIDLRPGDHLDYCLEAFDNDAVSGPKCSRSRWLSARFPSVYEIFERVMREESGGIGELGEIAGRQRDLREKADEMRRDLPEGGSLGWETREDLRDLARGEEEIAQRLRDLSEKLSKGMEKLEGRGLITPETLRKLSEIRELIDEVASEDMKRVMDELQRAIESLDPEEVRRSLENFTLSAEEFERKLDRTLSLLRRAKLEQQIDAAVRMADELLRRQDDINSRIGAGADFERLSAEERDIRADLEKLSDEISRISDVLPKELSERFSSAGDTVREDIIPKASALEMSLKSGDVRSSAITGAGLRSDLEKLAESLKDARSAFRKESKRTVASELTGIIRGILSISERQEELLREAAGPADMGRYLSRLAEEEFELGRTTSRLAERLVELSRMTFFVPPEALGFLGSSVSGLNEASAKLEDGMGRLALGIGREALSSLNRSAIALHNALERLSSASSGVGMEELMERLRELSERQEGINSRTEGLPVPKPGGWSPGELDLLSQLAAEQEALRRELESLIRKSSGGSGVLGDLSRVRDDMGEVAEDLRDRRVNRNTLETQKRILTRLLDSQRSIRTGQYSRRRRARPAGSYIAVSPSELPPDLGEGRNPVRERMLRALSEGYPAEYEALIRRYFESISEGYRTPKSSP